MLTNSSWLTPYSSSWITRLWGLNPYVEWLHLLNPPFLHLLNTIKATIFHGNIMKNHDFCCLFGILYPQNGDYSTITPYHAWDPAVGSCPVPSSWPRRGRSPCRGSPHRAPGTCSIGTWCRRYLSTWRWLMGWCILYFWTMYVYIYNIYILYIYISI